MSKTTSLVGATCALLLLSVLSTSCIQERQTVPEETTPELISPELRTMTFEISLPGVEGVEVKTRQAGEESIQTKEEWKISNLYLLEFAADGSHTLVREHIPLLYEISNGVHKAEGLEYDGSKVSFKYTTKDYDDEMTRIFFFVANVRGHDQLKEKFVPGKTTLADVLSYKLTDLSENFGYEKAQPRVKQMLNQDGTIPMTGFATVSGKDGESVRICPATTSSVSVKLVRLLARIDVVNPGQSH